MESPQVGLARGLARTDRAQLEILLPLRAASQVRDPVVRSFWESEFGRYDPRFLQEAIAPVQNMVGQLLMAPPIRNIIGQVRSTIDPRFMMDDGRILIANLAKGRLGEEKANLLGALLVTQFQLAAMEFANLLKGLFGAFRNPTAHGARNIWPMPEDDALDLFSLASYVHRRIDRATNRP